MRVRTVKREIRVLGLTKVHIGRRRDVLGVVYRGGLFMDGVLYFRGDDVEAYGLPGLIRRSRHYPQLRVVVCRAEDGFDCRRLWNETGIPVILLNPDGSFEAYGIEEQVASRVLKVASKTFPEPEALKVALKLRNALEEMFKSR
ncbi:MAG: putative Endonuclease V [Candidatus Bathyarchaeota archaeon B24]|nr:MAG: putative Endonuclease V [Candidatus Bathyarchaeota archaeon B24]RLI25763.1 MAG: hypothetical protein DRO57_03010 [Candidatus Bathyarchaeota archaeon]